MTKGRLTLLPHGPVPSSNESRERCHRLLVYCGADEQRYHDQHFTNLEQFIRYVSRFDDLRDQNSQTLVALTQTCPLIQTVIGVRRQLSEKLPTLANALWVIYVDPAIDPGFADAAGRLGELDSQLDHVPVFEDFDGYGYLVLTPQTDDYEYVRIRSRLLAARSGPSRSRQDMPAVSVNGNRPPIRRP